MCIYIVSVTGTVMSQRQVLLSRLYDKFYALPVDHPAEKELLDTIKYLWRMHDDEFDWRMQNPCFAILFS